MVMNILLVSQNVSQRAFQVAALIAHVNVVNAGCSSQPLVGAVVTTVDSDIRNSDEKEK